MKTEDKITVIQNTSSNLWLKPPRVYILVLIVIIILATTFLALKSRLSKSETTQDNIIRDSMLKTTIPASPSGQIPPAKPSKSEGGSGQKPNQSSQTLPKTQNPPKPEKK